MKISLMILSLMGSISLSFLSMWSIAQQPSWFYGMVGFWSLLFTVALFICFFTLFMNMLSDISEED